MWRGCNLIWHPWPTDTAPDLAGLSLGDDSSPLVVLLGTDSAGPLGRYGFVGRPSLVEHLWPGERTVADAFDAADTLRVVLLGYEMGAPLVHLPAQAPPRGQPAGVVCHFEQGLIVDHLTRQFAFYGAEDRSLLTPQHPGAPSTGPIAAAEAGARHLRRVEATLEHIAAGDIYQANISRRLRVEADLGPSAAAALHALNPVAHGAFVQLPDLALISNSMETLLRYDAHSRRGSSYPIKGTRPRHPHPLRDQQAADDLATAAKDRSEHVMIVDLVRNDLGKVCTPGSVHTQELMGIEAFQNVWHGISKVSGHLNDGQTLGDAVQALFPGGSITGTPKRRSMEIIAEQEGEARGAYTGSLALVSPDGSASVSILIRTLVRDQEGWHLQVGGGIVADSDPDAELRETGDKAAVFVEALGATDAHVRRPSAG